MKKIGFIAALSAILLMALIACSSRDELSNISGVLDVDLSGGTVVQSTDSHGGVHGDGKTYIELKFADDTPLSEIESREGWNKLPLTDQLNAAVYGKDNAHGGYVTNDDGEALFPKVENGYYFFYDRNSESKDAKDDSQFLSRYSFNFTVALYDADTQTLYYYELDT